MILNIVNPVEPNHVYSFYYQPDAYYDLTTDNKAIMKKIRQ